MASRGMAFTMEDTQCDLTTSEHVSHQEEGDRRRIYSILNQ